MPRWNQVAAIPVKRSGSSTVQVLLITSRDTRRWVIPKGWPLPKVPDQEAAAAEAWEEAGVCGRVLAHKIGAFSYDKRRDGELLPVEVVVYQLNVTEEAHTWPEMAQRRRAWFSPAKAAEAVDEPELKALLLALDT
jgi:8-oxo-dGTP pyrophosphatase MutT (NUDIX family)